MSGTLSFVPGPSQLRAIVPEAMARAAAEGILGRNHRSPEFATLYERVERLFREKLNLPSDYHLVFTSSATECWEIVAQSLSVGQSAHVFTGRFGERWFHRNTKLHANTLALPFGLNETPPLPDPTETICLVENETSNGTWLPHGYLEEVREAHPDALICVDATSSMAAIQTDWQQADLWFASVQKGFGLPAGMAVLVYNQQVVNRAMYMGDRLRYNQFLSLHENRLKWQTTHTPNVLGIYLLGAVLEAALPIIEQDELTLRQAQRLFDTFTDHPDLQPLVKPSANRSGTVISLKGDPELITSIHQKTEAAGLVLGKGYGVWKNETLRIANFPAHTGAMIDHLLSVLLP